MSEEYTISDVEGGFRDRKDFENWLKVVRHFKKKGINFLTITPTKIVIKRAKLLGLYKELDKVNGALLFGADEWEKEKEIRNEIERLEKELEDEGN